MGKVILLGQESMEEDSEEAWPACYILLGWMRYVKSNQIPVPYFYRKAKFALIKRPFFLEDLSLKSFIKDLQIIKIATNCHWSLFTVN